MDIVIDFTPITYFFSLPAYLILWRILILFGWIPVAFAFLWGAKEIWLFYIRTKWGSMQEFVLLAIDVPKGNEQSPKAVENLFTYLGGAHSTFDLIENYWEGKFQLSFSFEIASIEGYTQFLIRTPVQYRNLVESAIYSQYPDAEITEVNDYTENMPDKFPDDEYDIIGAEFIQANNSMYPIKTYQYFEHQLGEMETQYKDTMASLMDLCSSLNPGEQLWFQILVVPTGFDWPKKGDAEISRILKEKVQVKKNVFQKMSDSLMKMVHDFSEAIYPLWGEYEPEDKAEEEETLKMMNLKPKEKKQIEAIQDKISKLGFEFKIRFVYIAKKDVMNKPKVFGGLVGYMKQFMELDLNNLKPDMDVTMTSTSYLLKDYRLNIKKNNIMKAYKKRSTTIGRYKGLLNIEELATLWHFPLEKVVKAPLIQKTPGKKSEPPMELPISEEIVAEDILTVEKKKEDINIKGAPPENLPVI